MKKYLITLSTLVLVIATALHATAQSNPAADGKTYYIESFMPDGSSAGKEYIFFKDGTISGSECAKYGYDSPTYQVDKGGLISAEMTSPTQGKLSWKGKIKDDYFEGQALWVKEEQEDIKMTFRGKLVKD